MNFNSVQYLVFFPTMVVLTLMLQNKPRLRIWVLLLSSCFFYMCWDWRYIFLLASSTVIDYFVAKAMCNTEDERRRKHLLWITIATNMGVLFAFKYWNFFMGTATTVAKWFNLSIEIPQHHLLLPVGISFYTFHTISYVFDIYARKINYEPRFDRFSVSVAFFPQLVAGPIVRAADFLPQLKANPPVTTANVQSGLLLIFRGLFKKIALADLLAILAVDKVFANPGQYSSMDLLLALYGYAFQIYNDFSGYTDIATGSARIMGYHFKPNFNHPYLSRGMREFWTRWHISLSSWLRDYLYFPLGGSRGTTGRTCFNLMVTMFLGGLWHGASMNFVLWGLYHGVLLVFAHLMNREKAELGTWRGTVSQIGCFHLVLGGWLLFRISDMPTLGAYLKGMLAFTPGVAVSSFYMAVLLVAVITHILPARWTAPVPEFIVSRPAWVQGAMYASLVVIYVGLTLGTPNFIYFQF